MCPVPFPTAQPQAPFLRVGAQTLTATFTPADATDYMPATANNSLTVNSADGKSSPLITWENPRTGFLLWRRLEQHCAAERDGQCGRQPSLTCRLWQYGAQSRNTDTHRGLHANHKSTYASSHSYAGSLQGDQVQSRDHRACTIRRFQAAHRERRPTTAERRSERAWYLPPQPSRGHLIPRVAQKHSPAPNVYTLPMRPTNTSATGQ